MRRKDVRRSWAETAVLGFLARKHIPYGWTYEEILYGITSSPVSPNLGTYSLRSLKRHIGTLAAEGLIEGHLEGIQKRYCVTIEGYFHYYHDTEHKDEASLSVVPRELLQPLMVKGITKLTPEQVRYFREYLDSGKSLLILLPPGAGKTLLATIEAYKVFLSKSDQAKVIYLSPYKAINTQTYNEFNSLLGHLGMRVVRQDGDHHAKEEELEAANVVISTFESAFYALAREAKWISKTNLVIIDELTALDSTRDEIDSKGMVPMKLPRGANIDLLLTYLIRSYGSKVRFVSLGIPNASHLLLQQWLGKDTTILEPSLVFHGYEEKIAIFNRDSNNGAKFIIERKDGVQSEKPFLSKAGEPSDRVLEVVIHYLKKAMKTEGDMRPILVFVLGRKSASELATQLCSRVAKDNELLEAMRGRGSANKAQIISSAPIRTHTVNELANVVECGVGFHHAGLFHAQRRRVEEMMNEGTLSVIFATTTLTHGIDFPIGTVIVDGSLLRFLNFSRLEYLQLRGRVDHKDPFHENATTADVVVVLSDDGLGNHARIKGLLQGALPAVNSLSVSDNYQRILIVKAIQLLSAGSRQRTMTDIVNLVASCYDFHSREARESNLLPKVRRNTKELIGKCVQDGLVEIRGQRLVLAALGQVASMSGLSFRDIVGVSQTLKKLVVSSEEKPDLDLLELASSLIETQDEVREVVPRRFMYQDIPPAHKTGTPDFNKKEDRMSNTLLGILMRWIHEEPIDKVVFKSSNFQIYEAGLLVSARAMARNLNSIATAAELLSEQASLVDGSHYREIAKAARILAVRMRFGIKTDIASSPLGTIAAKVNLDDLVNRLGYPELIMRLVLRLLYEKGLFRIESLAQYERKKPLRAVDLRRYLSDRDLALHLSRYQRPLIDDIAGRIVREALSSTQQ